MAIVTISRMYGSRGSLVARRVADILGWHLLDNDVVDAVASRLGVAPAEVSAHDERVPSLVERVAAALTLSAPETLPGPVTVSLPPTEDQIVQVTNLVIREAVQAGNAVLVGRGAQWLLAERSDALHVFCYAPRDSLIAHAIIEHRVPKAEAAKMVDDMNRQREAYVKRYWNRDWRAVSNYHLCLDTELLGVDAAADIVARVAKTTFGP